MEPESRPIIQACYINGLTCRNGKRDDFPVDPQTGEKFHCNKWVLLRGADPQTGDQIDTWCCNEFAKIKIALENAQMVRQNIASTDKVSNQIHRSRSEFINALPEEAKERLVRNKVELLEENTG